MERTFILVAVTLPSEDLKVLAARAIVVARTDLGASSDVAQAFEQRASWERGIGLFATHGFPENTDPEEVAISLFDEGDYLSLLKGFDKFDVVGVELTPELTNRFQQAGFTEVGNTDLGCSGQRAMPLFKS